jgi:hypothetical protein
VERYVAENLTGLRPCADFVDRSYRMRISLIVNSDFADREHPLFR